MKGAILKLYMLCDSTYSESTNDSAVLRYVYLGRKDRKNIKEIITTKIRQHTFKWRVIENLFAV